MLSDLRGGGKRLFSLSQTGRERPIKIRVKSIDSAAYLAKAMCGRTYLGFLFFSLCLVLMYFGWAWTWMMDLLSIQRSCPTNCRPAVRQSRLFIWIGMRPVSAVALSLRNTDPVRFYQWLCFCLICDLVAKEPLFCFNVYVCKCVCVSVCVCVCVCVCV